MMALGVLNMMVPRTWQYITLIESDENYAHRGRIWQTPYYNLLINSWLHPSTAQVYKAGPDDITNNAGKDPPPPRLQHHIVGVKPIGVVTGLKLSFRNTELQDRAYVRSTTMVHMTVLSVWRFVWAVSYTFTYPLISHKINTCLSILLLLLPELASTYRFD